MTKQNCWMLYDAADWVVNRDFVALAEQRGAAWGFWVEAVMTEEICLGVDEEGTPFCLRNGKKERPQLVLSRQRNPQISRHFEAMGVPVFNNARVCELCNDKRNTHQFLNGIAMAQTLFLPINPSEPPQGTCFPVVLKPAMGHGGAGVCLVDNLAQWHSAVASLQGLPLLQQVPVSGAGKDLRVYVLAGEIVAGVMRTAREGIVSNFKRGGDVRLHTLTCEERMLVTQVVQRFEAAGAKLFMAGVDLLYRDAQPVVGEVEDVVGSRMLYQCSDIDLISVMFQRLAALFFQDP